MLRIHKSILVAALVLTGAKFAAAYPAGDALSFNTPADVKAITAFETKAAGEHDIDQLVRNYAPDAVVADYLAPGWYRGKDQIRAALQPQLAAVKSFGFHMDEINVASNGNFACAAMLIRFDGTTQDNKPFAIAVRQLDALRKIDGHWHIVQQHTSVPADPSNGAAIMDGPLAARGPLPWARNAILAPSQTPEAAKADIRAWLVGNIVPVKVDEALRTYGPGDDMILFDTVSPREYRGRNEYRAYFTAALGGASSFEYRMPAFFDESDGAFGVLIAKLDLKINRQDGTAQYMSFRQSDCLRRVDNKWYSFLEMGSFPVDTTSGKAIMANPAAFAVPTLRP